MMMFLQRSWALMREDSVPGLLAMTAIAVPWVVIDVTGTDRYFTFFASVAGTFAQFLLTSALLRHAQAHAALGRPGRAASFIGVSFVTTMAIGAGLAVLLLPGVFLYARWLIAMPLVIGEGATTGQALRESWRAMAMWMRPALVAVAGVLFPGIASLLVMFAFYPDFGPVAALPAIACNLLLATSLVSAWYLAVAAYLLVRDPERAGIARAE